MGLDQAPQTDENSKLVRTLRDRWKETGPEYMEMKQKEAQARQSWRARLWRNKSRILNVVLLLVVLWMFRGILLLDTQNGGIRGRVLDLNNLPVLGAQVSVEGTGTRVSTDEQGYFTLNSVPPGSHWVAIETKQGSGVAIRVDVRRQILSVIGDVKLYRPRQPN